MYIPVCLLVAEQSVYSTVHVRVLYYTLQTACWCLKYTWSWCTCILTRYVHVYVYVCVRVCMFECGSVYGGEREVERERERREE